MGEIKALTSLRGLFALWVVLFHLRAWSDLAERPVFMVDRGYLGVDFFFLLSGFILAARHAREFADGYRWADHLAFVIKRFGRMFPLHLAVLAVVLVWMRLRGEPSYWWTHIATEAALMHRWGFIHAPRAALNGPDWSISTEWAANLLFPAFVVATGFTARSAVRPVLFGLGALVALVVIHQIHGTMDIGQADSLLPLVRCFAEFGLGMILFQRRQLIGRFGKDALVLALLGVILIGLYFRADLLVVVAMIPLLPMMARNMGILNRVLSVGPLHFLGVISYSIYLIQLPMILAVDRLSQGSPLQPYLHWGAAPILIVAVAVASYRLIERPCNEAIRAMSKAFPRRQSGGRLVGRVAPE